ncbi:5-oxoprolinase subunit PxpA [Cognatishimia sp. WU-CL00825]|uniref:LamB/YcsF family protein n=1 Tax=Cognatishimia sp. WU-CL00825 TaxID=3127658 RepID=UPI003104EAEF
MKVQVDLNADMGESFGPWKMGNDAALLDLVTSANIACGWHAGDADIMAQTMAMAVKKGVNIGAHPGFSDLQGFGRRRMYLSPEELANLVTYQLGAAQAMAKAQGGKVHHLKLHGALSNMTCENQMMAEACYTAALRIQPDITIMALVATEQQKAVEKLGCHWVGEIFADRAYNDDATLVDRKLPGAVIHDATLAANRIKTMIKSQAIITESGKKIAGKIDTVCLHGDGPTAVQMAQTLRNSLTEAGIFVRPF